MCLQTQLTSSAEPVSFDQCCCSGHGAGWGNGRRAKYNAVDCKHCPDPDSDEFRELCPAGKGYDKYGNVIDDCAVLPNACENGECKNNMPGFTCICNEGYTIDETGTKCIDIDECEKNPCVAPSECRNTDGGYECECPPGFIKENGICMDVDECQSHHPNVETLMVVMNASVHLVSSKKMASAWMSTNARQKRTNANIFALIPLVPTLANVQKDSSNIEILVSTVMSALNRSIFVALEVFVLTMLVHSIANVNAVTV